MRGFYHHTHLMIHEMDVLSVTASRYRHLTGGVIT